MLAFADSPRHRSSAIASAMAAALRVPVGRGIGPTDMQDPRAALSLVLGVNRGAVD